MPYLFGVAVLAYAMDAPEVVAASPAPKHPESRWQKKTPTACAAGVLIFT
jgi:hypothetical protein